MAYIAESRIVHLDLAARNCLVHANSVVKIADFGLSRAFKPERNGWRLRGRMKIPFKWCPPECLPRHMWRADIVDYSPVFSERSDMWAFGVVCWEIATRGEDPCVFLLSVLVFVLLVLVFFSLFFFRRSH